MKDPNTTDELREAPLLRSLFKEDPFVAPKDFFEFFPHAVQQAAYQVDRERRRHTPLFGDVSPLRLFGGAGALLTVIIVAIIVGNAGGFDLGAACSGFVFGSQVAAGFVQSGQFKNVLVVGAGTLSRILDYKDRNTCALFGDDAGAAVFQACEAGTGIHAVDMHSDGELGEVREVPAGISRNPASANTVASREHFIRMQGKKLFPFAVRSMEDATRKCVERAGWSVDDVQVFIPHQANLRIIEGVRDRLGLPEDRVYVNIDRYGNKRAIIPKESLWRRHHFSSRGQARQICSCFPILRTVTA